MKKNNSGKQNDTIDKNVQANAINSQTEKNVRTISAGSGCTTKAEKEPLTECNPNNGAFFEERSNPLSSKGN